MTLFFGRECLDELTARARESKRGRLNLNFHDRDAHPANRLLNAIEPPSYVRPHRHLQTDREETFIVLRGAFGIVLFDERGQVTRTEAIRAGGELIGAHIPVGTYHTAIALEPGSVFFEVKAGPYVPLTDKEWPAWAPQEGTPEAAAYLEQLHRLFSSR